MTALELLSSVVPAINITDTGSIVLNWMDVFKISHLPIIDNGEYVGLISESDIYDMPNPDLPIKEQKLFLARPFVYQNQHIFEIMELLSKNKISAVPVLNQDNQYVGIITLNDLSNEIAHLVSADNPGAIIVLELNIHDYSLSEIAQIVEGNDTKILSLYVHNHNQPDKILITLKLNRTNVTSVVQTFERYSYRIIQVYSHDNDMDIMLQDRFDSFMKFLSI